MRGGGKAERQRTYLVHQKLLCDVANLGGRAHGTTRPVLECSELAHCRCLCLARLLLERFGVLQRRGAARYRTRGHSCCSKSLGRLRLRLFLSLGLGLLLHLAARLGFGGIHFCPSLGCRFPQKAAFVALADSELTQRTLALRTERRARASDRRACSEASAYRRGAVLSKLLLGFSLGVLLPRFQSVPHGSLLRLI